MSKLELLDKTNVQCYTFVRFKNVQSGEKMGVIHKLKPEIRNFILGQKKANPVLSCRGLTLLVEDKFQIKLSKSSINSIVKDAGLSMPIGRRLKKKRRKHQMPIEPKPLLLEAKSLPELVAEAPIAPIIRPIEPVKEPQESQYTGAILLQAADYLIGGAYYISEAIKRQLNLQENGLLAKIEHLIYLPLCKEPKETEAALSYLNYLQSVKITIPDILSTIGKALQEVRCIKVDALDASTSYLDGQMHSVWSTPHIPYYFSSTAHSIKSYINKYFYEDKPLVLFMAPGYDTPTKEFFNFILSLDSVQKRINKLTLYNHKFEEIEVMPLRQAKRHFFVLGVWPWQFVEYRKVNKIGEFTPFHFEPLKKDFYLAEIEIELSQPNVNQSVTLRGCALKFSKPEKTRLIILSNLSQETASPNALTAIYLAHWPNLEEAFQDYSRKIELFTYTGSSQRSFSTESLNLNLDSSSSVEAFFGNYLKALDLYVRWHFLPQGFEDKDFSTVKEQFYNLSVVSKREEDHVIVSFHPPSGYAYLKELEYACRRMNERTISDFEGRRLLFGVQ